MLHLLFLFAVRLGQYEKMVGVAASALQHIYMVAWL